MFNILFTLEVMVNNMILYYISYVFVMVGAKLLFRSEWPLGRDRVPNGVPGRAEPPGRSRISSRCGNAASHDPIRDRAASQASLSAADLPAGASKGRVWCPSAALRRGADPRRWTWWQAIRPALARPVAVAATRQPAPTRPERPTQHGPSGRHEGRATRLSGISAGLG